MRLCMCTYVYIYIMCMYTCKHVWLNMEGASCWLVDHMYLFRTLINRWVLQVFPSFPTYRILPPWCAPHLEIAISPHAPASVQRVKTGHTILCFAHVFAHGIHPHLRFPDRWRKVRVEVHLRDITESWRKGYIIYPYVYTYIYPDIATNILPPISLATKKTGKKTFTLIDLPSAVSSKSFLCGCVCLAWLCQFWVPKGH